MSFINKKKSCVSVAGRLTLEQCERIADCMQKENIKQFSIGVGKYLKYLEERVDERNTHSTERD